jgi:hypothetical protein
VIARARRCAANSYASHAGKNHSHVVGAKRRAGKGPSGGEKCKSNCIEKTMPATRRTRAQTAKASKVSLDTILLATAVGAGAAAYFFLDVAPEVVATSPIEHQAHIRDVVDLPATDRLVEF